MKNNNLVKKSIITLLIAFILTTIFTVVANITVIKDVAYATSNDEIYYSDDGYADNGESTLATETFNYSRKEISASYVINKSFPAYYNLNNSLLNACANVAGANIIGYYDRYYENLIPDHIAGIQRGANYIYYNMTVNSSKKQNVINELYTRMSTNNPNDGTTQEGYKTGISSYVASKGYNVSYSSVMTGSNLDINKLHQALLNGDPVSLYLSGYNISTLDDSNNNISITKAIYTGNHIMVVYGYEKINYYNINNGIVKSNTYLYVATGISKAGYYILNNNGIINDAEAVHIS